MAGGGIEIVAEMADADARRRAEALAGSCGGGVLDAGASPSEAARLRLHVLPDGLELRDGAQPREPGLRIDLLALARRWASGPGRQHPLGRAMGSGARTIIDATAGAGSDTMLIAAMGCEVQAIERSPVLHAMLGDALERARDATSTGEPGLLRVRAILDRVSFICADARQLLPTMPAADAIYIDPMFPPKRNASALPRKSVRIIRELVGEDDDALELLQAARASATRRIVLKRPDHVPPLMDDTAARFEGKLVRYDVYVD